MNKEDLRQFLSASGLSREELAEKMGVSKRAVDNWFTRDEIPLWAQKFLAIIIRDWAASKRHLSLEQFDLIHRGAKNLGYASVDDFVFDMALRAAEDAVKYGKRD